jgi:hypothetical protein
MIGARRRRGGGPARPGGRRRHRDGQAEPGVRLFAELELEFRARRRLITSVTNHPNISLAFAAFP